MCTVQRLIHGNQSKMTAACVGMARRDVSNTVLRKLDTKEVKWVVVLNGWLTGCTCAPPSQASATWQQQDAFSSDVRNKDRAETRLITSF